MRSDDFFYYRRRAQQERELAATCGDSALALTHLKMAEEYELRAQKVQILLAATPDRQCVITHHRRD
ncbi:hypothetical protein DAH55_19140 [Sphingomonas koreensis]|nr:hypothetical protein DAH56_19355 [Sphingomonas koreensis]RSU64763.1 hypothetical protein DAH55_19140 [Sphingomonas koreensis]